MSFNSAFLRIPMYMLTQMQRIDDFNGIAPENVRLLHEQYTREEVQAILEALRHAQSHPDFDFKALMPDLPFANDQIHRFLCKVLRSIQDPGA